MEQQEIIEYIKQGITINGNPTDGYTVFTIPTQHFKVNSLRELTMERFELAIKDLKERENLQDQLLEQLPVQDIDWIEYLSNKIDNLNQSSEPSTEEIINSSICKPKDSY